MQEILDWSEAWAMLIPLTVLLLKKPSRSLFPVACYVWIGLLLNIAQNSFWKFAIEVPFSSQPGDNIFIYHTHSIVRFLLFSWFYMNLKQSLFSRLIKFLPIFFILFVTINFLVLESFGTFSSRTLGLEAGLLLLNCLLYYFNVFMQDQLVVYNKNPAFWITTGLSIYTVVNFPIFLFYKQISISYPKFAIHIWDVHNVTFVILCIFLAKAFHLKPIEQTLLLPEMKEKNWNKQHA